MVSIVPTDESLMTRLKTGDLSALGILYRRHGALVKHAVRRFAPEISNEEIEDLVQDVFLQLKRTACHCEETAKCRAWLFGIAAQTARNWRKKGAVRGALLDRHHDKPVGLSLVVNNSPEETVLKRDLIKKTLQRLPDTDRQLLLLYEADGFSAREIGEMMGFSEGAVWTRLHRIRRFILSHIQVGEETGPTNMRNGTWGRTS